MRTVGQTNSSGGKNKEQRLQAAVAKYLKKAGVMRKKVAQLLASPLAELTTTLMGMARLQELDYYYQMLAKHIDLVERRLIKKGKLYPNIAFGKRLTSNKMKYLSLPSRNAKA